MSRYGDRHRLFLQAFISRKILTVDRTRSLYQGLSASCEGGDEEALFQGFLTDVNKKLHPLSLEIKRGMDENNGADFYALVNLHQDEQSKLATEFDAREISFFRKVIDLIVTSEDGTVLSTDLLNAGQQLDQPITASAAKSLLEQFVASLWISEDRQEGSYFLGPRSHIELLPHLRGAYGDAVVDCKLCTNTVIRGQRCASCDAKIHLQCATRYFGNREEPQCPVCRAAWTHEVPRPSAGRGRETSHRQREAPAAVSSQRRSSVGRRPRRHNVALGMD